MDLSRAYDHPNVILNRYASYAYQDGDDMRGNAYTTSVTRLLSYEVENGVTFAALDNATLEALREAYNEEAVADEGSRLSSLINELLGLEDE